MEDRKKRRRDGEQGRRLVRVRKTDGKIVKTEGGDGVEENWGEKRKIR